MDFTRVAFQLLENLDLASFFGRNFPHPGNLVGMSGYEPLAVLAGESYRGYRLFVGSLEEQLAVGNVPNPNRAILGSRQESL